MPPVIKLAATASPTTITNTTAESLVDSVALPSYLLAAGRSIRWWGAGAATFASTASLTVRARLSTTSTALGTEVFSHTITPTTSVDPRSWHFEMNTVAASTAAQNHYARFEYTSPSTSASRSSTAVTFGTSTSGKDHGQTLYLNLSLQWNTTSTALTADHRIGWLEAVR